MVGMIERLIDAGVAYVAEGDVYFQVDAWPRFGAVSHLSRDAMLPIANERGNDPTRPGKRDPLDFVLWQRSLRDEPAWETPWGPGRPGWHIECSAMSTTYLGPRFEIHGGGGDLAFPHHDCELAQTEAATGVVPWVAHWSHAGMLRYEGEKMSKSLGNLVLVRDLLRTYPGDAIRHYLVARHYRAEIDYTETELAVSADAAARLRRACLRAEELAPADPALADADGLRPVVREGRDRFLAAMDDDLDTPRAMPELDALAELALTAEDDAVAAQAGWMVRELGGRILGLRLASVPTTRS
jgi:L-cysteine:1D-myo-inositol 2-amino-2-deoxy-alpha-D-glucopyranoside ligase